MSKRRLLLWFVPVLLVGGFSAARADGPGAVSQFYGAFTTEVPIAVPPYHGLEPKIALDYNSGSQLSGVAGVGWGLAAASIIQRGGPADGRGAPTFTSSDVFLLDGQELMPCTTLGGTHCTRIQSYNRITRNADNTWTVTGKTGVRMTYSPLWDTSLGQSGESVYRWMLTSAQDPLGNLVNYSWSADAAPYYEWYLDGISYNGTTIRFNRQPSVLATSSYESPMGLVIERQLLQSIVVTTGGAIARAWQLGYSGGGSDARPHLTTVTQYGSDAVLDATGHVTSGSVLPPMTLGWTSSQAGFSAPGSWDTEATGQHIFYGNGIGPNRYSSFNVVDVDGDGRADACLRYQNGVQCWLASANGGWSYSAGFDTTQSSSPVLPDNVSFDWSTFKFLDIDNDGKADACAQTASGVQCFTSTGSGFAWANSYNAAQLLKTGVGNDPVHYADVDGDGRVDVCGSAYGTMRCYLGQASHGWPSTGITQTIGGELDPLKVQMVDVNGDAKADYCGVQYAHNNCVSCYLSTGAGWNSSAISTCFNAATSAATWDGDNQSTVQFVDVNGDGLADACARLDTGEQCYLSNGSAFQYSAGYDSWALWQPVVANGGFDTVSYSWQTIQFVDLNADGRVDLCFQGYGGLNCYLSTGSTWSLQVVTGTGGTNQGVFADGSNQFGYGNYDADNYGTIRFADVNGDGVSDACIRMDYGVQCWPASAQPSMVNTVNNGLGGQSSIAYIGSSQWSNTYLPLGASFQTVWSVTTSDGRGTSSSVSYNYGNGLWSDDEHTFLGFRYVRAVIDAQGDYTETIYHQHDGCISKPEWTAIKNSAGGIITSSSMSYTESATAPWTSLMTTRVDNTCNGTSNCLSTQTGLSYDVYGNVLETDEWGNVNVTGDERTTVVGYAYNTGSYLVGLLAYQNTYAGIGSGGTLMRSTMNVYDNNTVYTQAPSKGVLVRRQRWDGTTGSTVDTAYTVDGSGNVTSTIDPLGGTSTTAYDPVYNVFPVLVCDAIHHCASAQWNYTLGLPTSRTDANQLTTRYDYDAFGRKTQTTQPDGTIVQWAYLDWGNPNLQRTVETQPDGSSTGIWSATYQDGLDRTWRKQWKTRVGATATTAQVDIFYNDTSNRPYQKSLPYAPSLGESATTRLQYAYDGLGRLTSVIDPNGTDSSTTTYGGEVAAGGYLTSLWSRSTDENHHGRTIFRDVSGNVIKAIEYNGSASYTTYWYYDVLNRLIRMQDAAGNVATATWDSLDRKRNACDFDLGCSTFSYDAAARLTGQVDQAGNSIQFSYDAVGRPTRKVVTNGQQVNWYYDESGHGASAGRLTAVTYSGGEEGYLFDAYGRPTSSTRCVQGICQTMSQTYDAYGRIATVNYPDCEAITYHYDEQGRQFAADGLTSLQYNSRGHVNAVVNANGTTQSYAYDVNRDWLTSSTVTFGANTLYQASYGYDAGARITSINSTIDGNQTYGYDDLNRLTSNGWTNYSYDALGNLSSIGAFGYPGIVYQYNDPAHKHAATSDGTNTYSYDANGNQLSGAGRAMTWDAENRLTSVTMNGNTTRMDYDASGNRIRKGGTFYFGASVERAANGGLIKYYSVGGVLVARGDVTGRYWFHGDHLGSTRLLTNQTGGVVATYAYSPFGQLSQTSSIDNSITYDGQRRDADSRLVYMNARYYDPALMRFISADSMVPGPTDPQAYNRYSFAFNNPINNSDPTGHMPVAAAWITAAAICVIPGAGPLLAVVAIAGAIATTAGYAAGDQNLMTMGSILLGFGGGAAGLGSAIVSNALQHSGLSPGATQAVGWAWTAASVAGGILGNSGDPSNPADSDQLAERGYDDVEATPQISVSRRVVMVGGDTVEPRIMTVSTVATRVLDNDGDVPWIAIDGFDNGRLMTTSQYYQYLKTKALLGNPQVNVLDPNEGVVCFVERHFSRAAVEEAKTTAQMNIGAGIVAGAAMAANPVTVTTVGNWPTVTVTASSGLGLTSGLGIFSLQGLSGFLTSPYRSLLSNSTTVLVPCDY